MSPAVYWVLLAVALFVVFQCARSILVDTSTLIARVQGQPIIERYYEQTRQDNRILRERIKSASTRSGIEAMARNYLNLTGKDEILVVFR